MACRYGGYLRGARLAGKGLFALLGCAGLSLELLMWYKARLLRKWSVFWLALAGYLLKRHTYTDTLSLGARKGWLVGYMEA